MNNKIIFISLCIALSCASCSNMSKSNTTSQTEQIEHADGLGEMREHSYMGLLPAASCPGIEYLLTIRNREHSGDGTFTLSLTYKEAENGKDKTFTYSGKRYTQRGIPEDNDATVWQCISSDGKQIFNFLCVDESELLLLNDKFEKPNTKLDYSLKRIE